MVKKPSKKERTKTSNQKTKPPNKSKIVKREPTPAAILKKVAAVSDSTNGLQKEIKAMSKIFGDNQKVLVSMKGMIDTLTSTLENIQKQSTRLNVIESDTQKLYSGLNQVRTQSNLITKINDQTTKLQEEVNKMNQIQKASPKPEELSRQVEDSINSIHNNSQMIIKIAQRIDEVRDDLRNISGKTDLVVNIGQEIEILKNTVETISEKTDKIESSSDTISDLRRELGRIVDKTESFSNLNSDLKAIKMTIDSISGKAEKIDSLGGVIDGLKQQFETVADKTQIISDFGGKIDKIETVITTLAQRADSTAFVGEGLKSVQDDLLDFKNSVFDKTNTIEQKVSSINDMLKRQDALSAEFHKKTDRVFQELQSIKTVTNKVSTDTSKEMIALLKLSEYQSNIRMQSETKYGEAKDLEKMASQTINIVNLFDRLSIESDDKIPLPHEVRNWAVSKILDCADKWEIRFSEVFTILTNAIGRELLKESIRIQQIRDIYGIRAVDEIRKELNIS